MILQVIVQGNLKRIIFLSFVNFVVLHVSEEKKNHYIFVKRMNIKIYKYRVRIISKQVWRRSVDAVAYQGVLKCGRGPFTNTRITY